MLVDVIVQNLSIFDLVDEVIVRPRLVVEQGYKQMLI